MGFIRRVIVSSIVAVFIAAWLGALHEQFDVLRVKPSTHFFSDGYVTARSKFLHSARHLKSEWSSSLVSHVQSVTIDSLPIDNPTSDQDLTIDIVTVSGSSTTPRSPLLLHLSGVHGVEGHAGSAIQVALLEGLREGSVVLPSDVTLCLVHAVNPFGFHFGRRWNENAVDLNRNVLTHSEFAFLTEPERSAHLDYDRFNSMLNLNHAWRMMVDDVVFFTRAGFAIATHGLLKLKKVLVTGQYHEPRGIFHGGRELQPSHSKLLNFLKSKHPHHDAVVILDVHTGLGPQGVDTLMTSSGVSTDFLTGLFGEPEGYLLGAKHDATETTGAAAGYEDSTGHTDGYLRMLQKKTNGWNRGFRISQEFGTLHGVLVARALVAENAAWNFGSEQDRQIGANRARNAFYVATAEWERKVVRRGLIVAQQMLAAMPNHHHEFPSV